MSTDRKLFVFPDIETTGTDPFRNDILEFAWAITDESFEIIGEPRSFVLRIPDHRWSHVVSELRENGVVHAMHVKSGLWDALLSAEYTFSEVFEVFSRDVLDAISDPFKSTNNSIHFAGLSVEFDWRFLEAQQYGSEQVQLEKLGIHHRLLNLSAVKLLLDSQNVRYEQPSNNNQHRALSDVFEAIEQAQIFAKMVKGGLF